MPWSIILLLSTMIILHQSVSGNCSEENDTIRITYTGNMGVVIESDSSSVWIDGLHRFYKTEYQQTPAGFIDSAKRHSGHFKSLQWLLFSHVHSDHFNASLTKEIAVANPEIKISGAGQVVDSLSGTHFTNAWNRNGKLNTDNEVVEIEAFNLKHTWPARHSHVQNLMFSVILNGLRITHLGDAVNDDPAYQLSAFKDADVLVIPYWLLLNEEGRTLMKTSKAKKIIATHIEPNAKPDIALRNGENQQVILFDVPGEVVEVL